GTKKAPMPIGSAQTPFLCCLLSATFHAIFDAHPHTVDFFMSVCDALANDGNGASSENHRATSSADTELHQTTAKNPF
uniref:hypothetical protein n=1 Tax=uncultured Ruegeria sp. TaxID=259304 RepID=UPI00262CDB70